MGYVYLIHFDQPMAHAKHYLGYTDNIEERLLRHGTGNGSKIMHAVNKAGIGWQHVRTWNDVDRNFERQLKNQKNAPRLCPVCSPGKRRKK